MRVNCLACGHKIEIDDAYSDYQGQIKCNICSGMLEIKTVDGKIQSVQLVHAIPPVIPKD